MAFVSIIAVRPSFTRNNISPWATTTSIPHVIPHIVSAPRSRTTPRHTIHCSTSPDESSTAPGNATTDNAPIPSSYQAALEQARNAVTVALAAGKRRLFVELDTRNGDETYTALSTTLPTARALLQVFDTRKSGIAVLFPDAGAAALAKRDWGNDVDSRHTLTGIERYEYELENRKKGSDDNDGGESGDSDEGMVAMLVVPRASEVDEMASLVRNSKPNDVVIVVNPDLVDMGVTGLSLNARRLRANVIDSFDSVYFLRTYDWGVLLRCYPGPWTVWVDDAKALNDFRQIAEFKKRPSTDELESLLEDNEAAEERSSGKGRNPVEKAMKGFSRFLKVYMKG